MNSVEEETEESAPSAPLIPEELRAMEQLANRAFDSYRQLYYEGGISSVYLWPTGNDYDCAQHSRSFGAAILLKKGVEDISDLSAACWDAIHVAEIEPENDDDPASQLVMRMTSTILLDLTGAFPNITSFRLGGSLTRQHQSTLTISSANDPTAIIAAIGRAVEEHEGRMRSNLQEIYFGKTHEIVNELRPALPEGYLRNQEEFRAEMSKKLAK